MFLRWPVQIAFTTKILRVSQLDVFTLRLVEKRTDPAVRSSWILNLQGAKLGVGAGVFRFEGAVLPIGRG
jgi:hypothetical protein